MDRINNAQDINLELSTTAQLMDEIQQEIFTNGVFRAWQLKDCNIIPCKKQFTIYDLKNIIVEPAKVRDGFKVENNLVTTPNVFFQIDGVPNDMGEYYDIYHLISSQDNCYCSVNGTDIVHNFIDKEQFLQLVFCRIGDKSYDMQELRKLPFYSWNTYNSHVEKKLCDALNRVLSDNVLVSTLDNQSELQFISDILSISKDIIKLLDNYDYAERIPKVLIFLKNEDFLSDRIIRILCFIYELGFDVIIMNPSGLETVTSIVNGSIVSHIRNEKMVYDLTIEKLLSKKKPKGFLRFLFQ